MADIWVGLDLGQLTDFTALAILRRSLALGKKGLPVRSAQGFALYRFDVVALSRYPLGTPYTSVVSHVVQQLHRRELQPSPRLVIDATGCGGPIVEMFRTALRNYPEIELHAITITGGRACSKTGRYDWHVAKVELVGALRAALENAPAQSCRGLGSRRDAQA